MFSLVFKICCSIAFIFRVVKVREIDEDSRCMKSHTEEKATLFEIA